MYKSVLTPTLKGYDRIKQRSSVRDQVSGDVQNLDREFLFSCQGCKKPSWGCGRGRVNTPPLHILSLSSAISFQFHVQIVPQNQKRKKRLKSISRNHLRSQRNAFKVSTMFNESVTRNDRAGYNFRLLVRGLLTWNRMVTRQQPRVNQSAVIFLFRVIHNFHCLIVTLFTGLTTLASSKQRPQSIFTPMGFQVSHESHFHDRNKGDCAHEPRSQTLKKSTKITYKKSSY